MIIIAKPFNTREVVARVKAVLRRSSQFLQSQNKQVLEYPDLMINLSEYRVVAFWPGSDLYGKGNGASVVPCIKPGHCFFTQSAA